MKMEENAYLANTVILKVEDYTELERINDRYNCLVDLLLLGAILNYDKTKLRLNVDAASQYLTVVEPKAAELYKNLLREEDDF